MKSFREWLVESEDKKEDYKKFFAKKLEKYGVKSPDELSDTDKKKFYDEVDAEWTGEKEEPEVDEKKSCNEASKSIVNKKQLEWFIKLVKEADNLDALFDDLVLMRDMTK